ncbi:propanediol utilization protein [Albidovulum sp.]|uniref:propanediol utilization protein n=1 Tax=Albidovulum sp. TaxID=1872424 RepID=UPI00265A1B65|nr:propanediol utilization protein [uncultured Defluviimonas sp.]
MSQPSVRVAGHLGEFLQGRIGPEGPVALVTLPCPSLALQAWYRPGPGLTIHGSGQRLITPERARRFLARLDRRLSGHVKLRAAMPAGGGAGASTAALVALARLAGVAPAPEPLASACVAAEGASDPLMFPHPEQLLWASREGRVLGTFPPLPRMDVIGGFLGPVRRTDAGDGNFPDIADLIGPWGRAASTGRAETLAEIASLSASRTLALRGPRGDPTAALARELGAMGFAMGHTGSARALLFVPGRIAPNAAAALRAAGMTGIVRFRVGVRQ